MTVLPRQTPKRLLHPEEQRVSSQWIGLLMARFPEEGQAMESAVSPQVMYPGKSLRAES